MAQCFPPECENFCPYGRVRDSNGCQTCKCKPPRCPPVCPIKCPNGNILDKNGCPICQCKPIRPLRPKH
ncbi:BPTI/Kunitz domain-containing protein 4-like [Crassostrea angulata]|uniref:BPTI/Kunitz domain-containing protein 4-like n=1 Tax=Magallana angulata TaxID=2784310 RepID=UPI0022B1D23D|nr:BPTI/Kunitz domain-containing protein 4-like [Crassostrea angulata]